MSQQVWDELIEVLHRPRLARFVDADQRETVLDLLRSVSVWFEPTAAYSGLPLPLSGFMINVRIAFAAVATGLFLGLAAMVVSQALNMIAYVAKNSYQAIVHLSRSECDHALLFIPNLLRGFLVVVISWRVAAVASQRRDG